MKPFKLRICGQNVPVSPDDFADIDDPIERENRMGEWCPFTGQIRLSVVLANDSEYDALFHEVMEAANTIQALKLTHPNIQRLGAFWFAFIRDNPKLIRKLLDSVR